MYWYAFPSIEKKNIPHLSWWKELVLWVISPIFMSFIMACQCVYPQSVTGFGFFQSVTWLFIYVSSDHVQPFFVLSLPHWVGSLVGATMVSSSVSEHLFRYMYSIIVVTVPSNDATLFVLFLSSHNQALRRYLCKLFPTSLLGKHGRMKCSTGKRMATLSNVFSHWPGLEINARKLGKLAKCEWIW